MNQPDNSEHPDRRRFAGFGTEHVLPVQVAALEALTAFGGPDATMAAGHITQLRANRPHAIVLDAWPAMIRL